MMELHDAMPVTGASTTDLVPLVTFPNAPKHPLE
jgi:hypothetical protein